MALLYLMRTLTYRLYYITFWTDSRDIFKKERLSILIQELIYWPFTQLLLRISVNYSIFKSCLEQKPTVIL